ncbi:threonine/serine ThrE exporter family protein [Agromyces sp. SYSU T00266]|uniref:threonine/serine ThrE exporter family protein n=1 Tax=Agromyces zhanjiangensis TaxID=3158562 RepID=UPI00339AB112
MPTTPTPPPSAEAAPSTSEDPALLRAFLLGIAEGLTASDETTDRIRAEVVEVAHAYGLHDVDVVVLPTIAIVQTGRAESARLALTSVRASFRFDQITAMSRLIRSAKSAGIDPAEGIRRLNEIGAMPPSRHWFMRTLGHALLVAGLALLLAPSWQAVIVGFGLGAIVGIAKLTRSQTLALILPVAASFVCALIVFLLAPVVAIGDPLRLLIAPLATFLPGAMLTTGVRELAAGQMVAGSSRLGAGVVQLALLALGILAAGTVIGIGEDQYVPREVQQTLPWWVAGIGLVLYGVGVYLHYAAPGRSFGWVLLALVVAYAAQQLGALVLSAPTSGFVGALAATPLVLWIEDLRRGAVPSQLTFTPAFWILVPGAASLVGVTEGAIEQSAGIDDVTSAFVAVMSIALGVFIGSALYRFLRRSAAEIADFHVDLPAMLGTVDRSLRAGVGDVGPGAERDREPEANPKPERTEPDA